MCSMWKTIYTCVKCGDDRTEVTNIEFCHQEECESSNIYENHETETCEDCEEPEESNYPRGEQSHTRMYSTARQQTPPPPPSSNPDTGSSYRDRLRRLLFGPLFYIIALAPFVIIFEHDLYSISTIEGSSMSPTLNPTFRSQTQSGFADHVVLNRWIVKWKGGIKRGDIVYFNDPTYPDEIMVKRVIALEGDIVRVRAQDPLRHPSESEFSSGFLQRHRRRRRSRRSSVERPTPSEEEIAALSSLRPASAGPSDGVVDDDDDEEDDTGIEWRFIEEDAAEAAEAAILASSSPSPSSKTGSSHFPFKRSWKLYRIPPNHAWVEGDASVPPSFPTSHPTRGTGSSSSRRSTTEGQEEEEHNEALSRGISRDSRKFGPIPLALVTAKVGSIFWPPNRWGRPGQRSDLENEGVHHHLLLPNAKLVPSPRAGGGTDVQGASIVVVRRDGERRENVGSEVERLAQAEDSKISPYVLDPFPATSAA
ncbi:Mitochondrial inner membrane protease subunit 2 [Tilletia horrida]|nr:Mitochondrial inner membrane protease subunit 2 [Tilletia horrida]